MRIRAFGGSKVHVLGSITIFLHVGKKTFKALCQVTDTNDCFLMGRVLAKTMGYVDYPDIQPPTRMNQKPSTSIKPIQTETSTSFPELTSNLSQPKQSHKKQPSRKPEDPSSNLISQETLQLIQQTINCITSNLSLNRHLLTIQQSHRKYMQNCAMNMATQK